jgi:hypothetical protein
MGAKSIARRDRAAVYTIIPGAGPVAQVAHPTDLGWTPSGAIEQLLQAAAELPKETGVVLTGGGFITLTYPHAGQTPHMMRQAAFLQQLGDWTERELDAALSAIVQSKSNRDFVIGVDIFVNGMGSGQFALWVGPAGRALVAKRFPMNGEDRYLAGLDAASPLYDQRIVATAVGPTSCEESLFLRTLSAA